MEKKLEDFGNRHFDYINQIFGTSAIREVIQTEYSQTHDWILKFEDVCETTEARIRIAKVTESHHSVRILPPVLCVTNSQRSEATHVCCCSNRISPIRRLCLPCRQCRETTESSRIHKRPASRFRRFYHSIV